MRFKLPAAGQKDLFSQIEHAGKLAAEQPCALDKLKARVDFEIFRDELLDILGYREREDKGGNAPYDPVFMFRITVLQKYFGLSEEQTEFQAMILSPSMSLESACLAAPVVSRAMRFSSSAEAAGRDLKSEYSDYAKEFSIACLYR